MINSNCNDTERALKYQIIMLMHAHKKYKKSIGTDKEKAQKEVLNDLIETYKDFLKKEELQ